MAQPKVIKLENQDSMNFFLQSNPPTFAGFIEGYDEPFPAWIKEPKKAPKGWKFELYQGAYMLVSLDSSAMLLLRKD
jgi:hypothetical protein